MNTAASAGLKILVVNPGSTTTKLGLFEDDKPRAVKKIDHPAYELEKYPKIMDQYSLRQRVMLEFLDANQVKPRELAAVVSRGGLLKPLPSGTYEINNAMVEDLAAARYGEHASNIGAMLAFGFKWDYHLPAFVVDPPVVDEMNQVARLAGLKELSRRSLWHALNINAVTRQLCKRDGLDFRQENFVAVHLGGGISVAAIERGRCIDVSNGLEAGPYTPERSGSLPTLDLIAMCYSGKYTQAQMKRLAVGRGGLVNYLGTSNLMEIEDRITAGDDYAKMVFAGMCYQIAKEIGAYVAVLRGSVKNIILTGGAAHSGFLVQRVREYIEHFAPIIVIPGEDELAALAQGCLRVLLGEEEVKTYS